MADRPSVPRIEDVVNGLVDTVSLRDIQRDQTAAAGKGTRMKSKLPKVLHKAGGKPMLQHVIDAAKGAGAKRNIAVVGFGAEMVREAISADTEIVVQAEQLGTGHAVLQTAEALKGEKGTVMVLCGDTPLLTADMLKAFYEAHDKSGKKVTLVYKINKEGQKEFIDISTNTIKTF